MIKILKKINHLINIFGLDLKKIFSLIYIPRYILEYIKFSIATGKLVKINPILTDFYDMAGNAKGHYFYQDLLVSQFIFKDNPLNHLDIASRIDGFVAHVASFRKIEISDIRNLENSYLLKKTINCRRFPATDSAEFNINSENLSLWSPPYVPTLRPRRSRGYLMTIEGLVPAAVLCP